jgi:hypothetical protein
MKFLKYFALIALAAVPLMLIEKKRSKLRPAQQDVQDNLEPEIEWD